jgi:hypothetical protein
MIQVQVIDWIIPHFGNTHIMPYGTLRVTNGEVTKICKTKGDRNTDIVGYQYITFQRKRYKVMNVGSLYSPKIKLEIIK